MNDHQRSLILILAVTIAPLLLFIQKPFHIDDSAFLEVAQNILNHPFDPFHGTVALVDNDYHIFQLKGAAPNTFESMSHPPLVPYVMALVILLTGKTSEFPLHAAFLIFPVLTSIASFFLAQRFSKIPLLSVLIFVVSPIFMLNAQNLMTDLPMLAFMLSSLAMFVAGVDKQKLSFLVLAGLFAGLASLSRYVGLLTIPIFFSYAYLKEKKLKSAVIATFLAMLLFGIWVTQNIAFYGVPHLTVSYSFYKSFYGEQKDVTLIKFVSDFSALGGCSFLFAFLLAFLKRQSVIVKILGSVLLSAILLLMMKSKTELLQDYTTVSIFFLFLFVSAGVFLIVEAIYETVTSFKRANSSDRTEDLLFLFIWFSLSLFSALIILPFGTARYLLPALLPLILILSRGVNIDPSTVKLLFVKLAIVVTFAVSLIVSWADFEFALTYKLFARNLREMYPKQQIWFIGEWGFRYYMKEENAQYFLRHGSSPNPGDYITKAGIASFHDMPESISETCIHLEPFIVNSSTPIRVMNPSAKAGYYAHIFGLFPFSISDAPLEQFNVCKIRGDSEVLAAPVRN